MPRKSTKRRPEPQRKKDVRWYHHVPGVLWSVGSAATAAWISSKHGPVAGASTGAILLAVKPNPDYWAPEYLDGTIDAQLANQDRFVPYGAPAPITRIEDIDGIERQLEPFDYTWPEHHHARPHGWGHRPVDYPIIN